MRRGSLSSLCTLLGAVSAPLFHCDAETPRPRAETTASPVATAEETPVFSYRVVRSYPHDRRAYTQGLVYEGGYLYESTGGSRWSPAILGQSTLRKVELETGRVLEMKAVSPEYFGEGIAVVGDHIVQLTWQSRIGFVYDKASLDLMRQFDFPHVEPGGLSHPSEGWGITYDGKRLIMSDGTSVLRFWDPQTFAEIGRIEVKAGGRPVMWLNELEYVKGEILANIWQRDRVARISPETGEVTGWIDLTGLLSEAERGPTVDVLNGIAYDFENGRLFVTGKGWPRLFEIELAPPR